MTKIVLPRDLQKFDSMPLMFISGYYRGISDELLFTNWNTYEILNDMSNIALFMAYDNICPDMTKES